MDNFSKRLIRIPEMVRFANDSVKVRRTISKFDPSMQNDAKQANVLSSSNVIHHMYGPKRYLGVQTINGKKIDQTMLNEISCAMKLTSSAPETKQQATEELSRKKYTQQQIKQIYEIAKTIRDEVEACVLIPAQFHNWITPRMDNNALSLTFRGVCYPLQNRNDYYILYHKFLKDKTCAKKITKYSLIDTSLINALSSLHRLKGIINDDLNSNPSNKIMNQIKTLFDDLYLEIKQSNIYTMKQPDQMQENE